MKAEFPFFAAMVLLGSTLLARMATQGVEQAFLSSAIEYGLDGMRAMKRLLRDTTR